VGGYGNLGRMWKDLSYLKFKFCYMHNIAIFCYIISSQNRAIGPYPGPVPIFITYFSNIHFNIFFPWGYRLAVGNVSAPLVDFCMWISSMSNWQQQRKSFVF